MLEDPDTNVQTTAYLAMDAMFMSVRSGGAKFRSVFDSAKSKPEIQIGLARLLGDPSYEWQQGFIMLKSKVKEPAAIHAFVDLMKHTNPEVRQEAFGVFTSVYRGSKKEPQIRACILSATAQPLSEVQIQGLHDLINDSSSDVEKGK